MQYRLEDKSAILYVPILNYRFTGVYSTAKQRQENKKEIKLEIDNDIYMDIKGGPCGKSSLSNCQGNLFTADDTDIAKNINLIPVSAIAKDTKKETTLLIC